MHFVGVLQTARPLAETGGQTSLKKKIPSNSDPQVNKTVTDIWPCQKIDSQNDLIFQREKESLQESLYRFKNAVHTKTFRIIISVYNNINVINVSLLESYDHIIFNVNSFKT